MSEREHKRWRFYMHNTTFYCILFDAVYVNRRQQQAQVRIAQKMQTACECRAPYQAYNGQSKAATIHICISPANNKYL